MTTILTTCMGRLPHLRQTLPTWIEHTPAKILVVDYCDPDRVGEHVTQYAYDNGIQDRLKAVWFPPELATREAGRPIFNKSKSLNYGIERVNDSDILFLDSDTLVDERFWPVWGEIGRLEFAVIELSRANRSLTGVLHAPRFYVDGMFDESMSGWGSEDIDVRLKLAIVQHQTPIIRQPVGLTAIEHDDDLRVANYAEKDLKVSNEANMLRTIENLRKDTGWSYERIKDKLLEPEIMRLYAPEDEVRKRI